MNWVSQVAKLYNDEDPDKVTGTEERHFLVVGPMFLHEVLSVVKAEDLPERWYISLIRGYQGLCIGTLEDAKKQALTYLPKIAAEAQQIIDEIKKIQEQCSPTKSI